MSDEPLMMLNALWFKPPQGEKYYQRYLAAAHQVSLELGVSVKIQTMYQPRSMIIGELKGRSLPDVFFLVQYECKQDFEDFVNSAEYQEIRYLREEAIVDSLLIECGTFHFVPH
ncbi:hypothetical protein TDB9533_01639 [Thalassocella blandensis]|nr:hypothetical protein TDB9533_01639 [Thalassocella blandensis]